MHFFVYDSIKILLLLLGLVFIIGFARTYLSQDGLKQWINRKGKRTNRSFGLFEPSEGQYDDSNTAMGLRNPDHSTLRDQSLSL